MNSSRNTQHIVKRIHQRGFTTSNERQSGSLLTFSARAGVVQPRHDLLVPNAQKNKDSFSIFANADKSESRRGFTVLIATLIGSVVLAIGLSILGITLKQLQLSGLIKESEMAFQAAQAGYECIQYYDRSTGHGNKFDVGSAQASINCMGTSINTLLPGAKTSGAEQAFSWTWGTGTSTVCSNVSLYKFYSATVAQVVIVNGVNYRPSGCPAGVECTVIKARGYNGSCAALSGADVVERELTVVY